MKIVVLDITGRNAVQYNPSLCKALAANLSNGEVVLIAPDIYKVPEGFKFKKLISLVPKKWSASEARWKRVVRALESVINYIYLMVYITFSKPDILHIQWLPFIDFVGVEKRILSLLHNFHPKLKIILTVHNIYPHKLSTEAKEQYRKRFQELDKVLDGYIVHLHSAKIELTKEFEVVPEKVFVAYHGIYVPDGYNPQEERNKGNYKKIILFGFQNRYKGADILMQSLALLPKHVLDRLQVKILGKTDADLFDEYKDKTKSLNVEWINKFVPDVELYQAIGESDLILLPYLKISQSGVLLLALSYKKPVLTSNLPSFTETLEGYPEDYFFKSNSPEDLARMLEKYVSGQIDESLIKEKIERLNIKYSWNESAKSTLYAYSTLLS